MPRFVLDAADLEYEIAPGSRLRITRPVLRAAIQSAAGMEYPLCIVDTGAPLSVMSWYVGDRLRPHLRPVPVTLDPLPRYENGVHTGVVARPALLTWERSPCELVSIDVSLTDTRSGRSSGPLELLVKWVQVPRPDFCLDQFLLLGMHFFAANGCSLDVAAQPWGTTGGITTP